MRDKYVCETQCPYGGERRPCTLSLPSSVDGQVECECLVDKEYDVMWSIVIPKRKEKKNAE